MYEDHKQNWAKDMAALLIEIKHRVDTLKSKGLAEMDFNKITKYNAIYKVIFRRGVKDHVYILTQAPPWWECLSSNKE